MRYMDAGRLRGILTAIITPFNSRGEIDYGAIPEILHRQRAAGIDGVVVSGTNGEGTSLSTAERMQLLEVMLANRSDLIVVAGTGAASVKDAIALTRHAANVGADAALVLPSFFYKNPNERGLADYFRQLMDAASIPTLLYNIPQFTSITITESLLELLADHPNLAGIKDSSGDLASSLSFIQKHPELRIFTGGDYLIREGLQAGSTGAISGGANAYPEIASDILRSFMACVEDTSQQRFSSVLDVLCSFPLIAVSKSVLALRGGPRLYVRPPLINLSQQQETELQHKLDELGLNIAPRTKEAGMLSHV